MGEERYYETINRKQNRRLIYECRCDERLKDKDEGSTRGVYDTLRGSSHGVVVCYESIKPN